VLQAGGACYSWRLAPPRWLGGLWLCRSSQEYCARLRRSFVRGIVITPRGSRRATLVERVIELPHLMMGSYGAFCEARCVLPISRRTMKCWSTQQGLAWWQPSELREKNHRVNIILHLLGGLPSCNISLYLLSYILVLV
jgi:hypothetical protein